MTVFCLEMRSTANWNDVRYRAYTTSQRHADAFKTVAKIKFTDSGHHIIPTVKEHSGKRLPLNNLLADHVNETMRSPVKPRTKRAIVVCDQLIAALRAIRNLTDEQNGPSRTSLLTKIAAVSDDALANAETHRNAPGDIGLVSGATSDPTPPVEIN